MRQELRNATSYRSSKCPPSTAARNQPLTPLMAVSFLQESKTNQSCLADSGAGRIERANLTKKSLCKNDLRLDRNWQLNTVLRGFRLPHLGAVHFKQPDLILCGSRDRLPADLAWPLLKV